MNVVPYEREHIEFMDIRAHEQINTNVETLDALLQNSIGVTLISDQGLIIAILGYALLLPGVISVFVLPSIYVSENAFGFLKTVKRYVRSIKESTPDFRRMETRSLGDRETSKWMKALGFTYEGTHPKFAPDGSTYLTWAIVE